MDTQETTLDEGNDAAATAAAEEARVADAATAAEAEKEFAAGFAEARGDEPPEPAHVDDETKAPDASGDAADTQDESTKDDAGDPPAPAFMTAAEVQALLEQQAAGFQQEIRKVQGKMGQLDDTVKKHAAPRDVKLTRIAENFPDLAEMLAADLQESGPATGSGFDRESVQADIIEHVKGSVAEQVQAHAEALNERYLNYISPGWEAKVQSPGFSEWLASIPQDEGAKIRESSDPFVVADSVKQFDVWTTDKKRQADEAAAKAKRLAAAVPATGGRGGAAPPDSNQSADEAAFLSGFKSVRGAGR